MARRWATAPSLPGLARRAPARGARALVPLAAGRARHGRRRVLRAAGGAAGLARRGRSGPRCRSSVLAVVAPARRSVLPLRARPARRSASSCSASRRRACARSWSRRRCWSGVGPTSSTATVLLVEERIRGQRLLLGEATIEGLERDATPAQIRVSTRSAEPAFEPGDRVRMRALLMPPSPPVEPGGFDFARQAYFQRLGAVGYALSGPQLLARAERRGWSLGIAALRQSIAQQITARRPGHRRRDRRCAPDRPARRPPGPDLGPVGDRRDRASSVDLRPPSGAGRRHPVLHRPDRAGAGAAACPPSADQEARGADRPVRRVRLPADLRGARADPARLRHDRARPGCDHGRSQSVLDAAGGLGGDRGAPAAAGKPARRLLPDVIRRRGRPDRGVRDRSGARRPPRPAASTGACSCTSAASR